MPVARCEQEDGRVGGWAATRSIRRNMLAGFAHGFAPFSSTRAERAVWTLGPGRCPAPRAFASADDDFYSVLGVKSDATPAQIKQAYRERALLTHPDTNRAPDAKASFELLTAAYATLSHPKQRMLYDYDRLSASRGTGPSVYQEAPSSNWGDINCDLAEVTRPASTRGSDGESQRQRWREQANCMEREGTFKYGDELEEEQTVVSIFGPAFVATFAFFAIVFAYDTADRPTLDPFDLFR